MSVDNPTVQRLINFGGSVRESAQGGSGIEYYWVLGLAREEVATAHTLGLPKVGLFHVDPRLAFLGTVQSVEVFREMGPLSFIVRVVYSVGGTFNFSTTLGARSSSSWEVVEIPVMGKDTTGNQFYLTVPVKRARAVWRVVQTTRLGSTSVDQARDIISRNIQRFYRRSGSNWISVGSRSGTEIYQLYGADISTDAGNNTRIETVFQIRGSMPAFPAGHFNAVQKVDVPALPTGCNYAPDVLNGEINIDDPLTTDTAGEPLPWLN